ncbi:MAG TPA: hypothetical protein VI893_10645 [Thermoplasmata archaeon]|nr:hypothetical protein [Thermoplasmata archaeon]
MDPEDREQLAMVLVIGALLMLVLVTPILKGRSVLPEILPHPVVTISLQTHIDNGTPTGPEVAVAVSGLLGPVKFQRLQVWWDGRLVSDAINGTGDHLTTNSTTFRLNVTAHHTDGSRRLLQIFDAIVTVNYTRPPTGDWIPFAVTEFPDWKEHYRFMELDPQSVPYKGSAVEVEVKG